MRPPYFLAILVALAFAAARMSGGGTATNPAPAPSTPIALQSAAQPAPRTVTIDAQTAFLAGVKLGAMIGRRNPDMDEGMLTFAGQRAWQAEMQRLAATPGAVFGQPR